MRIHSTTATERRCLPPPMPGPARPIRGPPVPEPCHCSPAEAVANLLHVPVHHPQPPSAAPRPRVSRTLPEVAGRHLHRNHAGSSYWPLLLPPLLFLLSALSLSPSLFVPFLQEPHGGRVIHLVAVDRREPPGPVLVRLPYPPPSLGLACPRCSDAAIFQCAGSSEQDERARRSRGPPGYSPPSTLHHAQLPLRPRPSRTTAQAEPRPPLASRPSPEHSPTQPHQLPHGLLH